MEPATLRRLGLISSLSILASSVSGVLHTVMTRTEAPPPEARPSGGSLDATEREGGRGHARAGTALADLR